MKTFKQKNYDKLIKKVRLIFAHEIVNCIINQLSESIMFRSWKFFSFHMLNQNIYRNVS